MTFALTRGARTLLTAFAVVTVVFLVLRLRPGGPAVALLGEYAPQEAITELNHRLGLDRPIPDQYVRYVRGLARGDLGTSFESGNAVARTLGQHVPFTGHLLLGSLVLGLPAGIAIGILAAARRGRAVDRAFRFVTIAFVSAPSFVVAIILMLVFSVTLRWLPVAQISREGEGLASIARAALLPSVTLGLFMASYVARLTRSCLIETLARDYIRTARATGVSEAKILVKYALRNTLVAISTATGIHVITLLGTIPVVETVFGRPGIGSLLVRAIQQSDFAITQGVFVCFALFVMLVNVVVDGLYTLIDPRVGR